MRVKTIRPHQSITFFHAHLRASLASSKVVNEALLILISTRRVRPREIINSSSKRKSLPVVTRSLHHGGLRQHAQNQPSLIPRIWLSCGVFESVRKDLSSWKEIQKSKSVSALYICPFVPSWTWDPQSIRIDISFSIDRRIYNIVSRCTHFHLHILHFTASSDFSKPRPTLHNRPMTLTSPSPFYRKPWNNGSSVVSESTLATFCSIHPNLIYASNVLPEFVREARKLFFWLLVDFTYILVYLSIRL